MLYHSPDLRQLGRVDVLCRPEKAGIVALAWVVLCCLVLTVFRDDRMGENVKTDMVVALVESTGRCLLLACRGADGRKDGWVTQNREGFTQTLLS